MTSQLPPQLLAAGHARLATLARLEPDGRVIVSGPAGAQPALLLGGLRADELAAAAAAGDQLLVLTVEGSPLPIVAGVVRASAAAAGGAVVDGERLRICGEREIELACGEASVVLTRAGKVIIKGQYVLSQAAGVNRIRGGSVQIN